MAIFKDLGKCVDCGRTLMLRKGRCGACWKKREQVGEIADD